MTYIDIQPGDIQALRVEGDLLIFDTRDSGSYARGHLDDAQPISDIAIKQLIRSRRTDRPILIYCYRGNSSRDFCGFIAGFGFTRVYNLAGGWQTWEKFNLPDAGVFPRLKARPGQEAEALIQALADKYEQYGVPNCSPS